MRTVRLSKAAERDVQRLYDFLLAKNERSAFDATPAIRSALNSLDEFAERGRQGPSGEWRQLLIPFGPDGYVARYRVTPTEVVILRLFHGRERR